MEQNLSNLGIKPISEATSEAVAYIKARKEHTIKSLETRWKKLNSCCMGGIEPNTIYTITGISGSGKSSVANLIETDLIDLNPKEDVIVLSFTLEMPSFKQIGRKFSNKLRKTTSYLYSSSHDIDDVTYNGVLSIAKELSKYNIYYVDTPGTPSEVETIIYNFYNTNVKNKHKYFVILYDHALLTRQAGSVIETISELQQVFIRAKKLPLTSIVELSQMNRNIESPERINNPNSHFPMRSDISSSDSVYQASDYVIVIHRPETLGITEYGPQRWPVNNKVYFHILKNRDAGKPAILEFENDLQFNNLIEPEKDE